MYPNVNIVSDFDLLLEKGDVLPFMNNQLGYRQLIIVCPGCGEKSSSAQTHKWDAETLTYTPSIVHDKELGGCGWHGWLTKGIFTEC